MSIDSTVAQLWLPAAICDEMERTMGLQYDNETDLYLVNSTVRQQLLNAAPEFTFTVSNNGWSNQTVNIVLPYAALDLEVCEPNTEELSQTSNVPTIVGSTARSIQCVDSRC